MQTQSKFYKAKYENEKQLLVKEVSMKENMESAMSFDHLLKGLLPTSLKVASAVTEKKSISPSNANPQNSLNEWIQAGVQVVDVFNQIKNLTQHITQLLQTPANETH